MALTRRELLLGGLPRLARRFAEASAATPAPPPVRPPRALPEAAFLERCERCHACIEACPSGAIEPLAGRGEPLDGTPQLTFRDGWCEAGCRACAEACPTGALDPSLAGAAARPGIARVEAAACLNAAGFAMCLSCQERCPERAVSLLNLGLPAVDPGRCTGCGACVHVCPTSPKAMGLVGVESR